MININPTNETMGDGRIVIELVDAPWTGIKFAYDKMDLAEAPLEDGSGVLKFEYDVLPEFHDRVEGDRAQFEQYIGGLLVQVLEEQLARNEVIYGGGTGEYIESE
jgi:hypothetical protein